MTTRKRGKFRPSEELAIDWLTGIFRALPIRWRLTIWYVGLLAVILVLFAGSVIIGLQYVLYRTLDNTLQDQAALLVDSIVIEDGEATIGDRRIRNRPGQQFVRLVDQDGELLTESSRVLQDMPADDPGLEAALGGQQDIRWRPIQDERMRVLSQPVIVDDEVVAVVQVGLAGRSMQSILNQTVVLILTAGSIILVVAIVGGVWLADRALKPIDHMSQLAARISEQDLSQRINTQVSDDELGRLARTFNAMLDRLEAGINRQRAFTAAASHELRTPLAMMQSQIELAMARERVPEQDNQVFDNLSTDVNRLTRIASTLLTLARSDTGEIELEINDVDISALVELIAEQYSGLAANAGIQLVMDVRPARIQGDEDRLIQLLVNLVDNAFQHTGEGKSVTLGCAQFEEQVEISVSDEGTGIDSAHLPFIFDRFYRANSRQGTPTNGAGLGLAISKMIVDAHNGKIEVTSERDLGTTVSVRLQCAGNAHATG